MGASTIASSRPELLQRRGSSGPCLGVTAGYGWWYGYHVPAVRHRDAFYQKLEDERAAALGQK
ncbi:Cytochrome c oxidase subunit 7A [Neodidymelliopsis sp. IMI 364377]|nr:Cytochrome c oxidase subunit 7A [Neodidymelliopsis sp. IMI 364377]